MSDDMPEINWSDLPHEVKIESFSHHTELVKSVTKVFPTEAQALAFARMVVPPHKADEAEACRYDEVIWTTCHIEWAVSCQLHMPGIVEVPKQKFPMRERLAYWFAMIGDKIAPKISEDHPEAVSRLDVNDPTWKA